ncbi:hypothetical protein QJQ58_06580 [Paenibacillus dendritiformis]|nr:hypothetical protein [Paenibacillus dendritiformis]WGU95922.1 hypothetical protein QJQ58_06580 [Paenibacillus dendritiformis]
MSMALDLSYGLEVIWIVFVLGSVMFILKHKDGVRHDGDDISRG